MATFAEQLPPAQTQTAAEDGGRSVLVKKAVTYLRSEQPAA